MQFTLICHDGTDAEAPARRAAARPAHLALIEQAAARGEQIMAAALLNEEGQMNGSLVVADFPSREALDAWLAVEPYVLGKVWEKITVYPCKIGPSFMHLLKK